MNWKLRTYAGAIVVLYVVVALVLLFIVYQISPPTTPEQYKEFGVLAGIALTAAGVFVGMLVSFFTLGRQLQAQSDLEEQKGNILRSLEDHKKEIMEDIETLKAGLARQNEFLSKALDAKSVAYNELFVAANLCYRELQNLATGQYDKAAVDSCEQALSKAEGLAANLDDDDQRIVQRIVQSVFNIVDEASAVEPSRSDAKGAYKQIWDNNAKSFGQAVEDLRARSPFHNQRITPD